MCSLLPRQPRRTGETRERRSGTTDLLRLYLQDIGRVDLLTNEEEVTLARLVQRRERLLEQVRLNSDSRDFGTRSVEMFVFEDKNLVILHNSRSI